MAKVEWFVNRNGINIDWIRSLKETNNGMTSSYFLKN